MKKLLLILFLPIILNAQSILLWDGSESPYYAIDLDGSTEYAYIDNPTGLDLNSPNYVADSNSIFTGTVTSDWLANGNVSISFPSDKMQFVNTTSTSSDYVALSQDNLTSPLENGKNYTVQFDASSVGSSDLAVKVGNSADTISTTGTNATYAYTFKYDTTGNNGSTPSIQFLPQANDTYTVDNVDVSERYNMDIAWWLDVDSLWSYHSVIDFGNNDNGIRLLFGGDSRLRIMLDDGDGITTDRLDSTPNYPWSINTWYSADISFDMLNENMTYTRDNNILATVPFSDIGAVRDYTTLGIGIAANGTIWFLKGQIGNITFTRKNGLGETVNTSIYNWKGDASTFLDDKGSGSNDLIGVNLTVDDIVKYKGGYTP